MFFRQTEHIESYYAATSSTHRYPELSEDIACDVLIVGGGFAGLHTAQQLMAQGLKVTLIEASRVAWAASGRNGGMAILGWSCDMPPLERSLGHAGALRLWQLIERAALDIRRMAQEPAFACDYQAGHLWTSVLPRRTALLHGWQEEASKKWGYQDLSFIPKSELAQWVNSPRYQAALYDPLGGHLHPLKLAQALAHDLSKNGLAIYENTQALHIRSDTGSHTVRTDRATIRASKVVLACNAYLDKLYPPLRRKILAAGTYMMVSEPLSEAQCQALIPSQACVTDNQFILDYFRITADRRLLFGGGNTYLGGIPKDIPKAIASHIAKVFPSLNVQAQYAWGGHIDLSMSRAPVVGRQGGLYYLMGFSGHGVLPTKAASYAVADSILERDEQDLQLFMQLQHRDFPGPEFLSPFIEASGKMYYRLRDIV